MREKRYDKFKFPKKKTSTLRECTKLCIKNNVSCPKENSDCRHWIDYEDDHNCVLRAIDKCIYNENRALTLQEVGERLKLSFVRIKQIETKALQKMHEALE
jgi:DNA-directed RNA polymerase sigma subunit (sigma70/sigma32)|tara:strand:+ start:303 stop:605 length:303 start_codon:yes stop_codon:yes gene_type:complete